MDLPVYLEQGLSLTNPVYVLQQMALALDELFVRDWHGAARQLARAAETLIQVGAALPAFAVQELKRQGFLPADFQVASDSPRPGVLGLVAQPGTDRGFVLPLKAHESSSGWSIDETLPFRREGILGSLIALLQASGLPTAGVLPERLAFTFSNPLGYRAVGNSMTIAALLAVIDALAGRRSELLHCACALVEPGEGGRLQPVGYGKQKLEALGREFQQASLLVCVPGCPEASAFRHRFRKVWEVADFPALARALDEAGLLEPLLRKAPLQREEVERVHDHLRWLVRTEHAYGQASDLARRLGDLTGTGLTAEPVSATLTNEIAGLAAESWRHQGRFVEANAASRRIYAEVQQRGERFTSYDERADTAAEYAAALFDAHCFSDIPPCLGPWLQEIAKDPQQLRPQTRVKVFNTLGRAQVVLGEEGWDALFRRSLELQERLNPGDVPRTKCYLIHGMLRHGQLPEARAELETLNPRPCTHDISGRVLRFLHADLERREGRCWVDEEMETLTLDQVRPGHPSAFYFQATARQPGQDDPAWRLRRAVAFLHKDGRQHPQNIALLFADCLELGAAIADGDRAAWLRASDTVSRFLDDPEAATLRAYYIPALAMLTGEPDAAVVEHFLGLIPYF